MVTMVALPLASILVRTFFKDSLTYTLVTVFSMSSIMGIFTPIYFGAIRHKKKKKLFPKGKSFF